jgi:hypothetical protein
MPTTSALGWPNEGVFAGVGGRGAEGVIDATGLVG